MPTKPPFLLIFTYLIVFITGVGLGGIYFKIKSASFVTGTAIFDHQSASLKAKVVNINGKVLTIQNSKGAFKAEIADNIYIVKPRIGEPPPIPSTNLKDVEFNKDANIALESTEGNFKITSISYFPNSNLQTQPAVNSPIPSNFNPPPGTTISATPKP